MQIEYRDADGNIQVVRAGYALAANPFPFERSSAMAIATGLAANAIVNHISTHDPANGQYNSINLGLYVDLPKEVRARRVYGEWDVNLATDVNHIFQIVAGVWDAIADDFLTPLKLLLTVRRTSSPSGGHDSGSTFLFPMGNQPGQYANSHACGEITIVLPQEWYDLVASNPNAYIRFIMGLRNATSTAITQVWRAMFTVFGF